MTHKIASDTSNSEVVSCHYTDQCSVITNYWIWKLKPEIRYLAILNWCYWIYVAWRSPGLVNWVSDIQIHASLWMSRAWYSLINFKKWFYAISSLIRPRTTASDSELSSRVSSSVYSVACQMANLKVAAPPLYLHALFKAHLSQEKSQCSHIKH